MYAHCFVCNRHFGANERLHHSPIGRRIAFDPAKGRLWIVCRRCGQWCLVPLETRWEAIEECESLFKSASVRVSSENVGLAEIDSTLSLIRVGAALRDELANWRYGARIRRRRRRVTLAYTVGVAGMASVFGAAALIAGHPTVVGWLGLAFIPYAIALRQVPNWQKLGTVRIDNRRVAVRRWDLPRVSVDSSNPKDIAIVVEPGAERITLRSGRAIAFLSEILPRVNWDGGSEHELRSAVREVDAAESAVGSTSKANEQQVWERIVEGRRRELWPLSRLLTVRRLALEMAVTEEIERRTLNLDAWILSYAAERESEVAHIADNMFIPEAVHRLFGQMQRDHRDVQPNEEL